MAHNDVPIRLFTDLPHTVPTIKKQETERRKHYFVIMLTNTNYGFQSENLCLTTRKDPC
ncbi:hypothetical protein I79_004927 [Cricetulus griseus]|uniref:Uncharacterized protein n=1 Tax=Cricetulus griseus TaxID=10029 RepID=G3H3U0_CRIGR|nr:hypothetical protein I79_004927 [Cricetulus griseus]